MYNIYKIDLSTKLTKKGGHIDIILEEEIENSENYLSFIKVKIVDTRKKISYNEKSKIYSSTKLLEFKKTKTKFSLYNYTY